MKKRYGVNPPPTKPRPTNLVEPPILAVVKEDGTKRTFPKVTTEQVRQSLEEKYKVRKRHDIKELVANTDPAFLKDVWGEGDDECYECASETKYDWKDIEEFEATMTFVRYEKGRSSLRFILEDENGKYWSMMAQCIDDFVFRSNRGTVSGKWIVCKRGANYGLLLVK